MTTRWYLEGYDTFAGEEYSLGTPLTADGESFDGCKPEYETYEEALADGRRRLESLEKTQPSSSSGGQGWGGIQDRVYIVHPDGHKERVLGGDPHGLA